jgi:hypothetical protein
MRTAFVDPDTVNKPIIPETYKGTPVDVVLAAILSAHGNQDLDPKKSAEAIIKEVLKPCSEPPVLRLPLGKESSREMKKMAEKLSKNADATEVIALDADF